MKTNEKLMKLYGSTNSVIYNRNCKYYDKGQHYLKSKRKSAKTMCKLEGLANIHTKQCFYCIGYRCKSIASDSSIEQTNGDTSNEKAERSEPKNKTPREDNFESSKEKQFCRHVPRQHHQKHLNDSKYTAVEKAYGLEVIKKNTDKYRDIWKTDVCFWKRQMSANKYIQNYKCADCEKLFRNIR